MNSEDHPEFIERILLEAIGDGRPAPLYEAMRHAVGTGGKRVRPRICLAAAVAAGGRAEDAAAPAAAIELLHNYTLVHDDLPAMDNDTLRRGKPSVWARFGEANAILAGDALQALAFATAAKAPRNADAIVRELGAMAFGVVAGQVEDVAREKARAGRGGERIDAADVEFIYRHKCADLFVAAAVTGALAGGGAPDDVERIRAFAYNLGMAFQFEDDLLDGDSPFPRDATEERVREHTAAAVAALAGLPGDAAPLAALASSLVGRKA